MPSNEALRAAEKIVPPVYSHGPPDPRSWKLAVDARPGQVSEVASLIDAEFAAVVAQLRKARAYIGASVVPVTDHNGRTWYSFPAWNQLYETLDAAIDAAIEKGSL